ncbi:MAG: IS1182 family transposase [Bacteroidales bacterium]
MKRQYLKAVFKSYNQKQLMLLPPSLDELIEANHPVRIVDQVIESLDDSALIKQYKGGGTSSYHPRMLLKVMVYSYLCNIYSSRRMEAALKENIHFMWLSGMNRPDHNTLNRFRGEKLKDALKEIFSQVVLMLVDSGQVSMKEIYVDGTKIEANANRYTFVWGKAIKTSRARIENQLEELWSYTQKVAFEESLDDTPTDFTPVDPEKVRETISKIDQALGGKSISKEVKQKLNYARKNWPGNLERYQDNERILGNRNSFSKTDTDATFMRMKEDHMRNGQLKPGYNLQVSTNNQFILSYSLHSNPTDTNTLESHLEQFKKLHGIYPEILTADAGYGSEENYNILERKGIEAYVKYNYFEKDQGKKVAKSPFRLENMPYDVENDSYNCPAGQVIKKAGVKNRFTGNGYKQTYLIYESANCEGCSLNQQCGLKTRNRTFEVNNQLNKYKAKANQMLNSEKGLYHRSKRPVDVEPVFANIKHNKGFKRFNLRGMAKVEVETGLIAIAHNLKKWVA